jgi:hypothetical protein
MPKINGWVTARFNSVVCLDDVLYSFGDEVVKRVNVLLHKAPNLVMPSNKHKGKNQMNR